MIKPPFRRNNAADAGSGAVAQSKIASENKKLRHSLEQLASRLKDQERTSGLALKQSADWGAMQEQRAEHALARLEMIENSQSWRIIRKLNSNMDRFPRLKLFLKRCFKLAYWTLNGQLPTKLKQYRQGRHQLASGQLVMSGDSSVPDDHFWIGLKSLPLPLLDQLLSFMGEHGPVQLVVAVNFYAGGGAESVALDYAKSYAAQNPDCSVLIVFTDMVSRVELPELPANIMIIDLVGYSQNGVERQDYLFYLLRAVPVTTFHIVNSIVAYNLLSRLPAAFLENLNIVASVFCLQFDFDDNTKIIGYGKDFLPKNIDKIDCVVSDNNRFSLEAPIRLNIVQSADKFKFVYNKSKLDTIIDHSESTELLCRRIRSFVSNERLAVHWAGRLDVEKRPDLLAEIAALCKDFCDFRVFGRAVVAGAFEAVLSARSNVTLCGPYKHPQEWDRDGLGNAFLFTSRGEGMPNTLIEASYLGYPVVASDVGGVCELINNETGWPIDKFAPAQAYADALKAIHHNKVEAERRGRRLIDLVHSRHNEEAYLAALAEVPGYERSVR